MKHEVVGVFRQQPDAFMGQPTCSCGWRGTWFDVQEPMERKAYDDAVRQHKVGVAVKKTAGCLFIATGATWVVLAIAAILWVINRVVS